jgi:hypothetical protein
MTYEEIEQRFPEEFERREKDKLAYRYLIPQRAPRTQVTHKTSSLTCWVTHRCAGTPAARATWT